MSWRPRIGWWLLPVLVIVAVLSPMLFTHRSYNEDWFNHLWLAWNQHDAISSGGLPTYFLHTERLGVFYPQFVFYGGTLYAFAGYLSFPLNSMVWAYVATFALGFAMAYGGWSWLARQAGVRGWTAHVPGLVYVTSAYLLTNAYARGTWPEFVATSSIPLVLASGWWLLRAPRWRAWPVAAFVGSVVLLTGSHNITLVWGATFIVLTIAVAAIALGPALRDVSWRRAAMVLGVGVVAVCVNAWFLLPDLVYSGRTGVLPYATGQPQFNTLKQVFWPLRLDPVGSTTKGLNVQMPVVALAWALVALAAARLRGAGWRRLAIGVAVLLLGFVVLVTRDDPFLRDHLGHPGLWAWDRLPKKLTYVQFAYRLNTYVALLVCGLVFLGVLAVQRTDRAAVRRALQGALAAVCVFSVVLAVIQIWKVPSYISDRNGLYYGSPRTLPPGWQDVGNFADSSARVVPRPAEAIGLTPQQAADGGHSTAPVPTGRRPLVTDVLAGPYLVKFRGLTPVGRTDSHQIVVRRSGDPGEPLTVSITHSDTAPMVAGRVLTIVALLALLGALGLSLPAGREWRARARAVRRRRRRGARASR